MRPSYLPKPGKGYSEEIIIAVVKDYQQGIPYAELTRKYAVSHQSIKNWLRKLGLSVNRRDRDWKYIKQEVEKVS